MLCQKVNIDNERRRNCWYTRRYHCVNKSTWLSEVSGIFFGTNRALEQRWFLPVGWPLDKMAGSRRSCAAWRVTMHEDISPIHFLMLRCSLWCLITALPGCSTGSSLLPCLRGRLELLSLFITDSMKNGGVQAARVRAAARAASGVKNRLIVSAVDWVLLIGLELPT